MTAIIGDPVLNPATNPPFVGFRKGGRIRFVDAAVTANVNALDPRQVDVTIGVGAGVTLQLAYDGGEVINTTLADGPVEVHKGATAPATDGALLVADDNLVINRSVPLVDVTDNSDAPSVNTATVRILKNNGTLNAPNLRLVGQDLGGNGPVLALFHDSATPAAGDASGQVRFEANDSLGNVQVNAMVGATVVNPASGAEEATLDFSVDLVGTLSRILRLSPLTVAAEGACLLRNDVAAGAVPAFVFSATNAFGAGQPILTMRSNGVTKFQQDGDGDQTLTSDDGGATGVEQRLFHNSPTPANADVTGILAFHGNSTAPLTEVRYGQFDCRIVDVTLGSEDALFRWSLIEAGALNEAMRLGSTGILEVDDNAVMAAVVGIFDDHDDAMVLRQVYGPEARAKETRELLGRLGIWRPKADGSERGMVSVPGMVSLLAGAAVQARRAEEALRERVARLEAALGVVQ